MSDNHHRLKRLETLNIVSFSHVDAQGEHDLEGVGRTLDLSKGGILLEVTRPIPPEIQKVELALAIKNRVIVIKGEVLHQRKLENDLIGLGISFRDISEADRHYIAQFLLEDV